LVAAPLSTPATLTANPLAASALPPGHMSLRSFPVDSVEEDAEQTDVEEDVEAEVRGVAKLGCLLPSVIHAAQLGNPTACCAPHCCCVPLQIHRDEDVSIRVTQSPGFLCHIEATAAFRMPAEVLYRQVITHPGEQESALHLCLGTCMGATTLL
jgi:hypothetical protein